MSLYMPMQQHTESFLILWGVFLFFWDFFLLPQPQALFVFMALSFARDEIIWLLRHADNIQKKSTDDFIDK